MKAFVLAAGFGKRMGDLTAERPKPLLPLAGVPMIYYTLFWLHQWRVPSAIINLHYLGEQIADRLRDFPHFPVHFSFEEEILGTAGGLRRAIKLGLLEPDDACILLNPDTIYWPGNDDLPTAPGPDQAALLSLAPRAAEDSATGFVFSQSGVHEGPIRMQPDGDFYYTGFGMVHCASLMQLSPDAFSELGPLWQKAGEQNRLAGRLYTGQLFDAGTRPAYERLEQACRDGAWHPIPPGHQAQWREFVAALP